MLSHPHLSAQKSRFIQDMDLASSFPLLPRHSACGTYNKSLCVLFNSSIAEDSCRILVPNSYQGSLRV